MNKYLQIFFILCLPTLTSQWTHAEVTSRKFFRAESRVENRYVILLEDREPTPSQILELVADERTLTLGANIEQVYTNVVKGFSASLDEEQAIALSQNPRVKMVVEDSILSIPTLRQSSERSRRTRAAWNLDRLDQLFLPLDRRYTSVGDGRGVNVYVVDSGIRLAHQEFEGRARLGINATPYTFQNDCYGHGTHVAGIIGGKNYGVAKKANLIAVKVTGCSGRGSLSWVIAGLDWISQNVQYPAVVNMSLGRHADGELNEDLRQELLALDLAVKHLISQGITVAIAAGNSDSPAESYSPARVKEAIVVGASDDEDKKSDFSNWGSGIDLFAPGSSITSAYHTSDNAQSEQFGTSMAAPHVTGFVALLLQKNPSLTPARIENIVKDHATKGLVRGLENYPGTPNRLLSIRHVPDLTDFARLDPYFYLAMNPDVSAAVGGVENYAGGAEHWATQGVHQGRMSSPAHWPGYYFYLYQDLANFFGHNSWSAAHNHWYHSGRSEGRSGSPAFDPIFYFSLYPELESAFGRNNFRLATDHWIQNGIDEGRVGSVAFDPFFYLSAHGDVRAVVGEGNYRKALLHWFQYGINEGRRASWFFDPVAYFRHNPDLAGVFGATNYRMGLFHYIKHGRFEGRRAVP